MTKRQLDNFQKLLGNNVVVTLVTMCDKRAQYVFVYWKGSEGKPFRLDYIFVLYDGNCLRRYEIDGYLRSYVLKALEQALEK